MIERIILLPVYCLFMMNGTSNLPAYQYNATLEYKNTLTASVNSLTNSYEATIDLTYTAQLYFNDENSYYLDNHELTIKTDIYTGANTTASYSYEDYKYYEVAINETNFDNYFAFDVTLEWKSMHYIIGVNFYGENIYEYDHSNNITNILSSNEKYYEYRLIGTDTLEPQIKQYINVVTGDASYYQGTLDGYQNGYTNGYEEGTQIGYQNGYTDGYTLGSSQDETATAIFVGIINVALVPINFFLAMLNFEVFGINIGSMVSALLTIAIIVIIIRTIIGGGNKSD